MSQESKIPEGEGRLRRVLGPFSATCIVTGAIIGVGIFFTPNSVARATGSMPLAMTAWILGGMIAMAGALVFAELGGMYSRTGAQYEILRDAWSAPVAFLYVFCNATWIQAGAIAIIAWVASYNLLLTIHGDLPDGGNWLLLIAAALIAGITLANVVGVRIGSTIQNATVVAKVIALLAITCLAILAPVPAPIELDAAGMKAISDLENTHPAALVFAGLTGVFFSFGGWQHALWIGGEVRDSRRTIPVAIVVGVGIVTVVYLLVNWAYFKLLGFGGVAADGAVAANAVAAVWPAWGKRLVAAAVTISALGVLNAQLLSGPRLIFGMARDGKFFQLFARISPQTGTPLAAILFLGLLGLAVLLIAGDSARIDVLLAGVVTVDAVFFFLTGLALFRLRRQRSQVPETTFRTPLFPIIPLVFVIGEGLVLVGAFAGVLNQKGAWIGLMWIFGSAVCYAIFFRGDRAAQEKAKSLPAGK